MRSLFVFPLVFGAVTAIACSPDVATELAPMTSEPTESGATEPPSAPAEAATEVTAEATDPQANTDTDTLPAVYAEEGVAIAGADPVAYFTAGAYVPGSAEFAYDWSGATWHFSSAENRATFASNPAAYAPQYGGFCAWAVSQGYTAAVDPEAWKVVDGKLYLNYDKNIQARWAADIPGNIAKADANWPAVAASE